MLCKGGLEVARSTEGMYYHKLCNYIKGTWRSLTPTAPNAQQDAYFERDTLH